MNVEEKLKDKIKKDYKSIRDFSMSENIPYSSINNIFTRGIGGASVTLVIKICEALGIDIDALANNEIKEKPRFIKVDISQEEQTLISKYRTLGTYGKDMVDTVLDKEYTRALEQENILAENEIVEFIEVDYSDYPASAGTGLFMFDDIKTTTIEVPLNNITRNADLVIPVNGDSMEPMYDDGDMVAIEYRPTLEVGEIGIFIVDGEVYIKEFQKNKLVSLNPKYKPIYFNENTSIKFIGKVLGKIK